MNFSILDWIFVSLFINITTLVAFWTKKRISNYDSYLLADRSLKLHFARASLGATEIGLVTLMYFAQQGYVNGFSAIIIGIIALIGFIFVSKMGFIFKGFRRFRCRTVSVFFRIRFNLTTLILAGIITLIHFQKLSFNPRILITLNQRLKSIMLNLSPQEKIKQIELGHFQILIATGQLIGEVTDFLNLNCLFLVYPFTFSGKLSQYIGRIERGIDTNKIIYYYRDKRIEFLEKMFNKRLRHYIKNFGAIHEQSLSTTLAKMGSRNPSVEPNRTQLQS